MVFTDQSKPADIIKVYPEASDLLIEHNIYFCCEGDKPLKEQFWENGTDGEVFLSKLNADYMKWKRKNTREIDWDTIPIEKVVDYIENDYHAFLKDELPILGDYITKIRDVHGHSHLYVLHRLFNELKLELIEYTVKEEVELFPLIKQYAHSPSDQLLKTIRQMNLQKTHELTSCLLRKIREVTNGFQVPEGACQTYTVTYSRLEKLVHNTMHHVHLERHVLFSRL